MASSPDIDLSQEAENTNLLSLQGVVNETVRMLSNTDTNESDLAEMEMATNGLCKFAAMNVIHQVATRYPGMFTDMAVITSELIDPSSPLNKGSAEQVSTHSYFLLRDSRWYAGSPANLKTTDPDYPFKILSSNTVTDMVAQIQKRDRAIFPLPIEIVANLKFAPQIQPSFPKSSKILEVKIDQFHSVGHSISTFTPVSVTN